MPAMVLPSHCWQWRCRGNVGRGALSLASHADNDAVEAMLVVALPNPD
jgi:hypothetical protein